MLYVTNRNKDTLTDRYNGQSFTFPPNEPVPIPLDAARHIFAYDGGDVVEVLTRLGRMRYSEEQHVKAAKAWLRKFEFTGEASRYDARESMVAVTNGWKETFADRYDGEDYQIEPGKTAVMPEGAAVLFFGYKKDDKTDALIRQGWYNTARPNTRELADNVLAAFTIEPMIHATHPADAGKRLILPVK